MVRQKNIAQAAQEDHFLDLTRWADNLVERLQVNFGTQNIWPLGYPGPYIGYRNTSASRQNTGKGYREIYAKVFNAASGDTEKISFFFNYYLYFVDMGVGAGRPIETVERSKDANYRRLYARWNGMGDRQSRPSISMEIRHQLARLETLVSAYYGEFIQNGILFSFDDAYSDTSP